MAKRSKFQIRSDAARQRWHVRDDQKEGFWRGHLESWQKSGLSKRGYCTKHNLAYSSFMAWRREIELRDREKDPPANVAALLSNANEPKANPFVPVRIVPDKVAATEAPKVPPETISPKSQAIEIVLLHIRIDPAGYSHHPDTCSHDPAGCSHKSRLLDEVIQNSRAAA